MEPLFEAETVHTYELYKSFCMALKKLNHNITFYSVCAVVTFLGEFYITYKLTFKSILISLIAGFATVVVFVSLIYFLGTASIKSTWKSNKLQKDLKVKYLFYSDHVELSNSNGNGDSSLSYGNLYAVAESKKVICLMTSKVSGLIIDKANCNEELLAFLRNIKINKK